MAILHSAEHDTEHETIFAFLPPSPTTDLGRGADKPVLSQPGDGQQQGARPTTTVAANIAFPSSTFDSIPTTAVSPNEVRVSRPVREGSDCEPRSRTVTRVHGDSIVGGSRSAAGDAECNFSDDMDRTVLKDVQIKAPPSREGSIK